MVVRVSNDDLFLRAKAEAVRGVELAAAISKASKFAPKLKKSFVIGASFYGMLRQNDFLLVL